MFYNNSEVEFPNWWDDLDGRKPCLNEASEEFGRASSERDSNSTRGEYSESSVHGLRVDESEKQLESHQSTRVAYERDILYQVWEYGEIVPGNDGDLWRKDEFGNWIYRLDYGNCQSEFGWEIFDLGVGRKTRDIYVMRPMQWQAYLAAGEH